MTDLLIDPKRFTGRIDDFGYEYLSFETRALAPGEEFRGETAGRELAIVVLGGRCSVESSAGTWKNIGGRANVFEGRPFTLYLPVATAFRVTAESDCDLAFCYCRAEERFPAKLVTPDEVRVEIRGGGNATRQIHHMLTPEFPAQRLLVVEVYTPARQLVELSAAQTRRAQSARRSGPGRDLLLPHRPARRATRSSGSTPPTAASTTRSPCATGNWC